MTYVLDDVGDYLASHGVGTVGTNIFKGGFVDGGTPAPPDDQLAVYEYAGSPPDQVLGPSNPSPTIHPRIQISTRSRSYQTARAMIQAAYDALAPVVDQTINGTRYQRIEALSEPAAIGRDENGRHILVSNFEVMRDR